MQIVWSSNILIVLFKTGTLNCQGFAAMPTVFVLLYLKKLMTWKPCEEYVAVPEQELSAPERKGFTVVEWGGSRVNTR